MENERIKELDEQIAILLKTKDEVKVYQSLLNEIDLIGSENVKIEDASRLSEIHKQLANLKENSSIIKHYSALLDVRRRMKERLATIYD